MEGQLSEKIEALIETGEYKEARELLQAGIDVLTEKSETLALYFSFYAFTSAKFAELDLSRDYLQRSQQLFEELNRKDGISYAKHLLNSTIINIQSCNNKVARLHARRALKLFRTLGHEGEKYISQTFTYLVVLQLWFNNNSRAKILANHALQHAEMHSGKLSLAYAFALEKHAQVHNAVGEFQKALDLQREVASIRQRFCASTSPNMGITFLNESIYLMQCDPQNYALAKQQLDKALTILKNYYGDDHPEIATCYVALAYYFVNPKNTKEQKRYLHAARIINEKAFGQCHRNTCLTYDHLTKICETEGNFDEAETWCKQLLDNYIKLYGEHSPSIPNLCVYIAGLYQKRAMQSYSPVNWRASENWLRKAISLNEIIYGSESNKVAELTNPLSVAVFCFGDIGEAERLVQHGLQLAPTNCLDNDQIVKGLTENAKTISSQINVLTRRRELLLSELTKYELRGSSRDPKIIDILIELGRAYRAYRDTETANSYLNRALELCNEFGSNWIRRKVDIYECLAEVALSEGNFAKSAELMEQALSKLCGSDDFVKQEKKRLHQTLAALFKLSGNLDSSEAHQIAAKNISHNYDGNLKSWKTLWGFILTIGSFSLLTNWITALMFVVVIAIHECGHFVGMYFYGYRNLKIVFLPFSGGLTTGKYFRKNSVHDSERVIIRLLGPVPGIILGLALLTIESTYDNPLLHQFASLSVVINFIALLPFQPLDGGYLLDDILLKKQPVLQGILSVLAGIGMFMIGCLFSSQFITLMSIFFVITEVIEFAPKLLKQRLLHKFKLNSSEHFTKEALALVNDTVNAKCPQSDRRELAEYLVEAKTKKLGTIKKMMLLALYTLCLVVPAPYTIDIARDYWQNMAGALIESDCDGEHNEILPQRVDDIVSYSPIILGRNSYQRLELLRKYAECYVDALPTNEADFIYSNILDILPKLKNKTNSKKLIQETLNQVSNFYSSTEFDINLNNREKLLRVIDISTVEFGLNSETTLSNKLIYASFLAELGEKNTVQEYINSQILPFISADIPIIQKSFLLEQLAYTYVQIGSFNDAGAYYDKVIDLIAGVDDREKTRFAGIISRRAKIFMEQNKPDEGDKFIRHWLDLERARLGNSHKEVLSIVSILIEYLIKTGKLDEAEMLMLKLDQEYEKIDSYLWERLHNTLSLGELYLNENKLEQAQNIVEKIRALEDNLPSEIGVSHYYSNNLIKMIEGKAGKTE